MACGGLRVGEAGGKCIPGREPRGCALAVTFAGKGRQIRGFLVRDINAKRCGAFGGRERRECATLAGVQPDNVNTRWVSPLRLLNLQS